MKAIDKAVEREYPKYHQTRKAFTLGFQSRLDKKPETACPYPDHRTDRHNRVTFSRMYIRAWLKGRLHCTKMIQEGEVCAKCHGFVEKLNLITWACTDCENARVHLIVKDLSFEIG